MKGRFLSLVFWFAAIACSFACANPAKAQDAPCNISGTGNVKLATLSPPRYPQLAQQARIAGDVKIQVRIRRDGSVASADVVSGHPLLKSAALASAQNSTFECRGCADETTLILFRPSFPHEITFISVTQESSSRRPIALPVAGQLRPDGTAAAAVARTPKPPSDLRASRKGNRVTLTWSEPTLTTDRQSVRYIGPTLVCRSPEDEITECGNPAAIAGASRGPAAKHKAPQTP
jgi:TonB family protein